MAGFVQNAGFERSLVEAVGIEPTSEELRSPVSPCAAGYLISPQGQLAGNLPRGQPEKSRPPPSGATAIQPVKQRRYSDRRAEPRERRGYLSSQCVVVIGSCSCLHPIYERMTLDTLPTTGTVPRQNLDAPRFRWQESILAPWCCALLPLYTCDLSLIHI